MSNPVTPYLVPVLIGLIIFAIVVIAAHHWDVQQERRERAERKPGL
ncbi:MAG: hypothetical protein HY560_00815 [Gemmatimonadetes bacterium]|nr:hypothetical protein [Gemmatimonadota bacterium]